jgi:prepilin-type N-terminal cleavage/methylation domain-containing protein
MIPKTGSKGFTFIEVMVTVVVLSLGTVMIQGGLLRAADILNRYSNTLIARQWIDEKIWRTQEALLYSEAGDSANSGTFVESGREFNWSVNTSGTSGKDTYKIALSVTWSQGGLPLQVTKEVYAAK